MRKTVWACLVSLALLIGTAITPAPIGAASTSYTPNLSGTPDSWVQQASEVQLNWIGGFILGMVNQHATSEDSDGDSSRDETSLQSTDCELESCTEAGVTIDPNG